VRRMEHPPYTLGRSCFFYALEVIPTNGATKRVILDRDQHNLSAFGGRQASWGKLEARGENAREVSR
jgi:hypothetical protein